MRKPLFPLFAMLLSLVFACRPASGPGPAGTPAGRPLQRVNGTPVTDRQFRLEIAKVPPYARSRYEGSEGARRFLDELVDRELLYQEALRRGLDRDPEFTASLESFRRARLAEMLLRREAEARGGVAEPELRAYYEDNRENFVVPPKIHAAQILVDTPEEAREIRRLLREGADFGALARERSQDAGSREAGGDLGMLSPGRMGGAFDKAAFALKPGQVSEPVRSERGYLIIKVLERREGEAVSYEKVRDFLREQLAREKKQEVYGDLIQALRRDAELSDVDTAGLEALVRAADSP